MRIIAGRERGRRLLCPAGRRVRPTSDRVREALFDILQHRVPGAKVLDLFAGTGALGIEALSRGARCAVFVDNHPASLAVVRANLERCRLAARAQVVKADALAYVARAGGWDEPYEIIFADPPYRSGMGAALLHAINPALLARDGLVVYEHARGEELPEAAGDLTRLRQQRYGDTMLSFYSLKTATLPGPGTSPT
ncbi:MAG: hypothetical protein PWP43_347 [Bacillota bacterium]|nr:hypothetical protein [Bacillota bacterium]